MEKQVFIHPQSKIVEQAQLLADIDSRTFGFKKGSEEWQQRVYHYLLERYENSSVPHIPNPGSANIPSYVYDNFSMVFGRNGLIAKKYGFQTTGYNLVEQRLSAAITNLANILLDLKLGLKPRDLAFTAGSDFEKKKTLHFLRYTFVGVLGPYIEMILNTDIKQYEKLLSENLRGSPKNTRRGKEEATRISQYVASVRTVIGDLLKSVLSKKNQ